MKSPAVSWSWSHALLGAVYALPAAVVLVSDPSKGLALALGVMPAAALGLPGPRARRLVTLILGVVAGGSMIVGALLAEHPWIAVPGIFALCVGAALIAPRGKVGRIGLGLCLPLLGIGLSFHDLAQAAALGALMALGSLYAWAVSLLWPTHPAPRPTTGTGAAGATALDYGIRLGLAASIAAAIGFALTLEHVGWACAAVLLVMRPASSAVRSRGIDRLLSVFVGAIAACLLILADPADGWIAGGVLVSVAALAATAGSRRYVTGIFTTYLVFLLLLVDSPQDAGHRFAERVGETVLGIGLALLFGVFIPWLRQRVTRAPAPRC